jgi:hypothetical protein
MTRIRVLERDRAMVRRSVGATFSADSSTSTTELRRDRVGVLAPDRYCPRRNRLCLRELGSAARPAPRFLSSCRPNDAHTKGEFGEPDYRFFG